MTEIAIFLAKYLIYILAGWAVASIWFLGGSRREVMWWLIKLGLSLTVVSLVVFGVGLVFPASRPFVDANLPPVLPQLPTNSFPSSHAATAAVLAVFIWTLRRSWGIVAAAAAILIGTGRIIAGLHYPVDVAGGLVIGVVISTIIIRTVRNR